MPFGILKLKGKQTVRTTRCRHGKPQLNQAKSLRGGCSSGGEMKESAKWSCSGKTSNDAGEIKTIRPVAGGNSIFKIGATAADFCSDCLPTLMALQRQQGCSPSNVSETAWVKDCERRLFASIVVQATVCSAAQCAPVVDTSAVTTRNFARRANTVGILNSVRLLASKIWLVRIVFRR